MNTYSELQSFVADFLARDDLTTQIRTFIRLAEQRMSRELDIALLETTTQLAVTANATTTALPTDLRSIREAFLSFEQSVGTRVPLQRIQQRIPAAE